MRAHHEQRALASVFAMIVLLAAQVGTGMFSDDEIANSGPFTKFVSNDTVSSATAWHALWGKYLLLALIVLHIGAMLYYLLRKKDNLMRPMIRGGKRLEHPARPSRDDLPSRIAALVVFAFCAGLAG